ncbi:MAG: EAL domain-containing protein [Candidatus Devosia phytovorans]|uniref:EAL domain-containing protein n=1 Tax=Candidatus Devosia phytovorans TaxID=3121372 RepID=A0AAJ5VSC4_9HYPH|nr:EAL domain-containing protein [Devosia sp.]WEK03256.1 MAG: EAL domain-containing protein [Devosia sp.]
MPKTSAASKVVEDETNRLEALEKLQIDNRPEAEFDHIVQFAAAIFGAPTALISLVEDERQIFKARIGLDESETARDASFCAHTIQSDQVLVVPDARLDDRFRDNPLVTGEPFIRFYAGAPLITESGHRLGSVCVIDKDPRQGLSSDQKRWLSGLARIAMDHFERKRLDRTRRAAMSLAGTTPDAIIAADAEHRITFWNAAAEKIFEIPREAAVGRRFSSLLTPSDWARFKRALSKARSAGRSVGAVLKVAGQKGGGGSFSAELSLATWKDEDQWRFGVILRDIGEREAEQNRLRYLTHFDPLTDLPNRTYFSERIEELLSTRTAFSVYKIGLDRFKQVNGSLGLDAGDALLQEVSKRVLAASASTGIVARLGSDEFGVLWPRSDDLNKATGFSAKLLAGLMPSFSLNGVSVHVSASIGIVLSPSHGQFTSAAEVLKGGLLSLHKAKAAGGRRAEVYKDQLGDSLSERQRIEEGLWTAFERDEFEVYYQPQVRLDDGKIVGAEALLRWRHPDMGLLSPATFIPVLETSELASAVGEWVLNQACGFAARMARRGHPVQVGVNLFSSQMRDGLLDVAVARALKGSSLPAKLLELEITETTVVGLEDAMIEPLRRIREMGVGIAFDDYGTGYASLSLLKRYPLSRLKVDREFVQNITTDTGDAAIVRAVLAMARSLNLKVIAEGAETAEQVDVLKDLGCEEVQGYFFGRPMPSREFERLLQGLTDDKLSLSET